MMYIFLLKCLRLCWHVLCLAVLATVLLWRGTLFFSYPTMTKTYFHTPPELTVPDVSLCFSLQSLLNNSSKYFFQPTDHEPKFVNQTIKHLYEMTPRADETLTSCAFRDRKLNSLNFRNASYCMNSCFQVKKYRMQGYICYRYKLLEDNGPFNLFGIAYSLKDSNVIYKLSMSDKFASGHKMCPMIHYSEYPIEDRNLNQEILPSRSRSQIYQLVFDSIAIYRLKAPYDTNCQDDSQSDCLLACCKNVYATYQLARTFDLSLEDEFNLILPSFNDTYNGKKLPQIMTEARSKCTQNCFKAKCTQNLTRTFVSLPYQDPSEGKLTFIIKNAAHPLLVMKYNIKFSFIDYLTEMANLSAIFVGFSIFTSALFVTECGKRRLFVFKFKQIVTKVNSIMKSNQSFTLRNIIKVCSRGINDTRPRLTRRSMITFVIIKLLIILGSSYQIVTLTVDYLEYRTVMTLSLDLNPLIPSYPKLIVCFRAAELLTNRTHEPLDATNYDRIQSEKARSLNYTFGELMKKTPEPYDVLGGCRMRPPQDQYPALQYYNRTECESFFSVDKFYWSRSFCYEFNVIKAPFNQTTVSIEYFRQQFLKALLVHPGLLYTIIIDEMFHHLHIVHVSVYPNDDEFTPNAFAIGFYQKEKTHTLALLSYHVLDVTFLTRPYQTDCNLLDASYNGCIESCSSRKIKILNRLPSEGMWNATRLFSSIKLETYLDSRNSTFYRNLLKSYLICTQQCRPCKVVQSITYLRPINKSKKKFELAVDTQANPVWYLKAVAEVSLFDYLFDLFCCFNFWYGLSMLSFDPFSFLIKKKRAKSLIVKQFILMKNFTQRLFQVTTRIKDINEKKHFLGTRMIKSLKRPTILIFLISPACFIHLFGEVKKYLEYPSAMYFRTSFEASGTDNYELAICLDLHEILAANRNLSINSFSLHGITLAQMFAESPDVEELMTACGYRGLNGTSTSSNITDLFFFQQTNVSECFKVYSYTRYLLKGFTCYQFSKSDNRTDGDVSDFMARHVGQMMISMNSSRLTRRLMVVVAEANNLPYVGGVWAVELRVKRKFHWYAISYLKYEQHTLPHYYTLGDFKDIIYGKCYYKCLDARVRPLNLAFHGLHEYSLYNSSNYSYITAEDRADPVIGREYLKIRTQCRETCATTDSYASSLFYDYVTTDLLQLGNQKYFEINDSQSFYLYHTEYPVTIISFTPAITLLQLFIALGSIFAIWFGVSISSFFFFISTRSQEKDVSLSKLNALDSQLSNVMEELKQLESLFTYERRFRRTRTCNKCYMPI